MLCLGLLGPERSQILEVRRYNTQIQGETANLTRPWIIFEQPALLIVRKDEIPLLRNRNRHATHCLRWSYGISLAPHFFFCVHAICFETVMNLRIDFKGNRRRISSRRSGTVQIIELVFFFFFFFGHVSFLCVWFEKHISTYFSRNNFPFISFFTSRSTFQLYRFVSIYSIPVFF